MTEKQDSNKDKICLADFLCYNDILYYGSPQEKVIQSFRMLDLTDGKPGIVTQALFLEFMEKYTICRAELLLTKVKINQQMMLLFIESFTEIAGRKESFTLHDFIAAKTKNAKLLSVLEDFESLQHSDNKVEMHKVKEYHNKVVEQFNATQNQIKLCTSGDTATKLV